MGVRHSIFNPPSGNFSTMPVSFQTPSRPLPRHSGQSSAREAGAASAREMKESRAAKPRAETTEDGRKKAQDAQKAEDRNEAEEGLIFCAVCAFLRPTKIAATGEEAGKLEHELRRKLGMNVCGG